MLVALLPLLTAVLAGSSLSVAAAALTLPQWLAIGDAVLSAGPGVLDAVKKLHPLFAQIAENVLRTGTAIAAHRAASDWLVENGEAAIKAQVERDRNY